MEFLCFAFVFTAVLSQPEAVNSSITFVWLFKCPVVAVQMSIPMWLFKCPNVYQFCVAVRMPSKDHLVGATFMQTR